MSDKMLMEEWRKFLVELKGDPADYAPEISKAKKAPCETVKDVIDAIKIAQQIYEIADDKEATKAVLQKHAAEGASDIALALAIGLLGAGTGVGVAIGAIPMVIRGLKAGWDKWKGNMPEPAIEGIEAFIDIINIAEPFQKVFNEKDRRDIDDQYIKYLATYEPNTCMDEVMDINQFIQDHYKLCKDDYESSRPDAHLAGGSTTAGITTAYPGEGGRDYGENPLTPEERAEEDKELAAYKAARRESKESKFHDNWRNFLKEEIDGFTGLSDKFAAKEWTKEYGEQIARLFVSDGSYGLEMAEMTDAPPEIIEQIKEIISKVATLLDAAERGDFGSLREPGRPQNWVREILQGMGAIVTDLTEHLDIDERHGILMQVNKFGLSRNSVLYDLIDHGKQVARRTGITTQRTADSYDYVKDWVGEENTRQAVYDREQSQRKI